MSTKGQYAHLTIGERRVIAQMKSRKCSYREMAKVTGRNVSTISREIKRNLHDNGHHEYYTYSVANKKSEARKHRCRPNSKFSDAEWDIIDGHIRENWSPEQVANTLRLTTNIRISTETIYQHIYKDRKAGGDLHLHLRHRFRKRRKRYRKYDSRGVLRGKSMIQDRPKEINERMTIGHWEADTVLGKGDKDCIVTLTERLSGLVLIGHLKSRTVEELNKRIISMISNCSIPILTITSDNGTEFHGYKEVEQKTGVKFYFATPHHAWERGTNENTNGLIRQYLPKGQSMNWINQAICEKIAYEINSRPRKRHQYRSPIHVVVEVA